MKGNRKVVVFDDNDNDNAFIHSFESSWSQEFDISHILFVRPFTVL